MSEREVLRRHLPAIGWARGFFAAFVLALVLFFLTGCVTETTRTITTDKGGAVTDTTVTRKGSDPAALRLVSVAAEIYLPRRPIVIREEKAAASELGRILRGRPITRQEIAARWKPLSPTP